MERTKTKTLRSTRSWSITKSSIRSGPADRENPLGWTDAGKSGPKAECLAYIKEVWTDMRPLSLRKRMEELANNPQPIPEPPGDNGVQKDDLIDLLSQGSHPVESATRKDSGRAEGVYRSWLRAHKGLRVREAVRSWASRSIAMQLRLMKARAQYSSSAD